ncbi:MAG: glycosyltransferase family 4 protein [Bacilli bacterium]
MNVLFVTISSINSINEKTIYTDLLREFIKNGHKVYIISPIERKYHKKTYLIKEKNSRILRVRIGNIQKTNLLEKGISTVLIEYQINHVIKQYFSNVRFDLILYSTPPTTYAKVIEYIKKRDNAKSYLLLKDIFPQNAVDMEMFSKKSLIYKYFRKKEKRLYQISDQIGCMSQANVDYVKKHNSFIDKNIIHVCPNSIEIVDKKRNENQKIEIREQYHIPQNKKVFIYGGNLGKPQDIPFVIECLKDNENKEDRFFVICGTGTEYEKIKKYINEYKPKNVLLIQGLLKDEYEDLIAACDVGLIFLDHRFTIPNFPSRLLSYMQNSMPVVACTDVNTDIGQVIENGEFGWWCESNSVDGFTKIIDKVCGEDLRSNGRRAAIYLQREYAIEKSYHIIMNK